jgi:FimV-like protein
MISLIINSYFVILLSIGIASICVFSLGLYCILRKIRSSSVENTDKNRLADDLSAIAGDDVMITQLDLARAYIETDRQSLAEHILKSVIAQGTVTQREEAKRLLNTLCT